MDITPRGLLLAARRAEHGCASGTSGAGPRREWRVFGGAGVALTGLVCPCHVLAGAVVAALAALGGPALPLSPALQDSVHAVYLPSALLVAAKLLTGRAAKGTPPL